MIYEPAEDSFLLEKEVLKFAKRKRVLDMGSGSGIQSLAAKKAGAKSVFAIDTNIDAIKRCKSLGIKSVKSNLFQKVKGNFDLIIFNPPYLPEDILEDSESKKVTTGGKKGDEIILKFLPQAKKHLAREGTILLLLSSLTPKKKIIARLKKLNLSKKIISSQKVFFEMLEVWKIREPKNS